MMTRLFGPNADRNLNVLIKGEDMFSLSEALIVSAIITAIFYGILLVIKLIKHKHINIIREIFICILVFVTAFIMSMTVIPKIEITPENSISILKPYSHGNRVNFIPFSFVKEIKYYLDNGMYYSILFNLIGNIIPFSVFSFLCVLLFEKLDSFKNILMLGFAFSLIIELLQIPLYRGSDIDDLILNMVGYALGYLFYKIVLNKHQSLIKKARINTLFC